MIQFDWYFSNGLKPPTSKSNQIWRMWFWRDWGTTTVQSENEVSQAASGHGTRGRRDCPWSLGELKNQNVMKGFHFKNPSKWLHDKYAIHLEVNSVIESWLGISYLKHVVWIGSASIHPTMKRQTKNQDLPPPPIEPKSVVKCQVVNFQSEASLASVTPKEFGKSIGGTNDGWFDGWFALGCFSLM